jgi:hypothetical protein
MAFWSYLCLFVWEGFTYKSHVTFLCNEHTAQYNYFAIKFLGDLFCE